MNKMEKKEVWLVNFLRQKPSTQQEIVLAYQQYFNGEGLPKTNFRRLIDNTFRDMGVRIDCARKNGYRYFVVDDGSNDEKNEMLRQQYTAMTLQRILHDSMPDDRHLMMERQASADGRLYTICQGINRRTRVRCYYEPNDKAGYDFEFCPYGLKQYRKKWYVVAKSLRKEHQEEDTKRFLDSGKNKNAQLRTFCIDRMQDVRPTETPFCLPAWFDINEFFEGCIGTFTGGQKSYVQLKVSGYFRDYIKETPLHESQTLVEVCKDYDIYGYWLRETNELRNIIISKVSECEVLIPQSLRDMVAKELQKMMEMYKTNSVNYNIDNYFNNGTSIFSE